MAAPRRLTLPLEVDTARASHNCQHSARHRVAKGQLRLKIKVGRSYEHYCQACADQFLGRAIEQLQNLRSQLNAATELD